jgi:hypothetical protein
MYVESMRTSEQATTELGSIQRTHLKFCFGNSVLRARGVVLTAVFKSLIKGFWDMVPDELEGSSAFFYSVHKESTPLQLLRS